jgi:hypothetical protein
MYKKKLKTNTMVENKKSVYDGENPPSSRRSYTYTTGEILEVYCSLITTTLSKVYPLVEFREPLLPHTVAQSRCISIEDIQRCPRRKKNW